MFIYIYIWPLNDAFCVLWENTHTQTPILCVATATIYLTYPKHTHTRTLGILQDEGEVHRRHALGVDTFNRIAFRLPNAKCVRARLCACRAFFSLSSSSFYTRYTLYMCVDAIFYRPTHYAQASGAICPVGRSAADPFNNVPGCRCQFPTLFNKPSAGTVS